MSTRGGFGAASMARTSAAVLSIRLVAQLLLACGRPAAAGDRGAGQMDNGVDIRRARPG